MYSINLMSRGSRIGQQFWQSPRGAGEYIRGDPPNKREMTRNDIQRKKKKKKRKGEKGRERNIAPYLAID